MTRVRVVDQKVVIDWKGASPNCAKGNSEARAFIAVTTVPPPLKLSTWKSAPETEHCAWETEKSFYEPREE